MRWQKHHVGQKLPNNLIAQYLDETWLSLEMVLERVVSYTLTGMLFYEISFVQRLLNVGISKIKMYPLHLTAETDLANYKEGEASTSAYTSTNHVVSFESLLLSTVKQKKPCEKHPKKKVAASAEIISRENLCMKTDIVASSKKRRQQADSSSENEGSVVLSFRDFDSDNEFLEN